VTYDVNGLLFDVVLHITCQIFIWALPLLTAGSGFPLQVLAPPASGCGLSSAIPNANPPAIYSAASVVSGFLQKL